MTQVLAVDTLGRIATPLRTVSGRDAVAARLIVRLRTVLGEWPDDTALGLPWLDPPASSAVWAALIQAQVEQVEGVAAVLSVDVAITGPSLSAAVRVQVAEDDGGGTLALSSGIYADTGAPPWYVISGDIDARRLIGG